MGTELLRKDAHDVLDIRHLRMWKGINGENLPLIVGDDAGKPDSPTPKEVRGFGGCRLGAAGQEEVIHEQGGLMGNTAGYGGG
jgi:hypothetical protein